MRAVILASGRGTRFDPLTKYRPKPLLPAANQPILRYLIQSLETVGFTDIIITLGYLAPQLENFLSILPHTIHLTQIAAPNWSHGPLASFTSAIPHIKDDEPFVLLPADLYISAKNLQSIIDNATDECAILYNPFQPRKGPVVQFDKDNHVTQFYISSTIEPTAKSSLPILYATPQLFNMIRETKVNQVTTIFEILQLWIKSGHSLCAIPIESETWFDVDFPSDLLDLNSHLIASAWPPTPTPLGEYIPPNTSIDEPLTDENLTIGEETQVIGPVLLDSRVKIGNRCTIGPGTSLGTHTIVQDNTALVNCITLPKTKVPPNAELRNTILDQQGNAIHGTKQNSHI
ncbi:MAG: sugar phosphate nucleotidyltransferase [Promethearchaeota archaeon]